MMEDYSTSSCYYSALEEGLLYSTDHGLGWILTFHQDVLAVALNARETAALLAFFASKVYDMYSGYPPLKFLANEYTDHNTCYMQMMC